MRSVHVFSGIELPATNTPNIKLALKAILEGNTPPIQYHPITYTMLVNMFNLMQYTYDDM